MFDFHMHTHVSFDGRDTAVNMAKAAVKAGLWEICFTDHMDYDPLDPKHKLNFAVEDYAEAYDGLNVPGLTIRRGFEFGMLPDNFGSYVKAYLLQTAGYWDISQTDSLTTYGVVENELGLCQIDVVDAVCGHSLQPVIEKLIFVCRKLPVLCYLTNMAMMLFGSFLSAYLMRRKKRGISWGGPLWISWGTIMIAAPASCKFRYMLPLYFALPFVMWITTRYGLRNVDSE